MDRKRASKLISYFLRHAPQEASLQLDEKGWTPVTLLLTALASRGFNLSAADLQALSNTFDKVRWEFSEDGTSIRATHGHSVTIEADEQKRATPPAVLYHGTPVAALESILREGLQPMTRQAVHLAATPAAALEVGRRSGKAVLLEIDAEAMHQSGAAFYQTSEGVWLTAIVPPAHLSPAPWYQITNDATAAAFRKELMKELSPGHSLYAFRERLKAAWRFGPGDDVLFGDEDTGRCFVVHLTWHGKTEENSAWPQFAAFDSVRHWLETDLIADQRAFFF